MILHLTQIIIEDIKQAVDIGIDPNSPLINDYLVKHLIIAFSSEVERHLKILLEKKIRNVEAGHVFKFCRLCNKIRNPKFNDIKSFCKDLNIDVPDLTDEQKSIYSDVISKRDLIAHEIQTEVNFTLPQIKQAVDVAEIILSQLKKE